MVGASGRCGGEISREPSPVIAVRSATAADAEALAALRWEFRGRRDPTPESESDFLTRCVPWMRSRLRAGSVWRVWIAEDDHRVVGQIWLQIFEKLPNPNGEPRQHAYISNLYVQPASRGGVGSRLLDAALNYARSEAVDRVLLWPSMRSVTLYQRRGFRRENEVFELKL
jgi:ribosomal protein S18 acetylase RimI-like enzyme